MSNVEHLFFDQALYAVASIGIYWHVLTCIDPC